MDSSRHTLFTDFLAELGVPHTAWYSDRQFNTMTFKSLFGLSKLLENYGIGTEAYMVADKAQALAAVTSPLLARSRDSFVIITDITPDKVYYRDPLRVDVQCLPTDAFCDKWSGEILLAFPEEQSRELRPDVDRRECTRERRRAGELEGHHTRGVVDERLAGQQR